MAGSALEAVAQNDNRRENRQPAEGTAVIDGRSFALMDWSSSGFRAEGYDGGFEVGDRHPLEITIEMDGESFFFVCTTYIVRADEEAKQVAGAFLAMDPEDRLAVYQTFNEGAD